MVYLLCYRDTDRREQTIKSSIDKVKPYVLYIQEQHALNKNLTWGTESFNEWIRTQSYKASSYHRIATEVSRFGKHIFPDEPPV